MPQISVAASAAPRPRRAVSAAPNVRPTRSAPAAAARRVRPVPSRAASEAARTAAADGARQALHAFDARRPRWRSARSCSNDSSICRAKASSSIGDVELPVAEPALDVQIARADARPAAVGHRRLGVHHRAVPLEDPDAGFEQRAIAGLREPLHDRQVRTAAGHQQPDVDAVGGRRDQRLDVRRRANEIRVGDPEPLAGQGRDELVEAEQAPPSTASC